MGSSSSSSSSSSALASSTTKTLATGTTIINDNVLDKLCGFIENSSIYDKDLYLGSCKIKDDMLNEIILKWFINNKKLFDKIISIK